MGFYLRRVRDEPPAPVGVKLCLAPSVGGKVGGWLGGKVGPILTLLSDTLYSTVPSHSIAYPAIYEHGISHHTIYPTISSLSILCITAYQKILY